MLDIPDWDPEPEVDDDVCSACRRGQFGCTCYRPEEEDVPQGRCACGRFLAKYATMPECMDCWKRRHAKLTLDILRINQGYREVIEEARDVKTEIEKVRAA